MRKALSAALACLFIASSLPVAQAQVPVERTATDKKRDRHLLDLIEDARKSLTNETVDVVRGQVGTRRVRVSRRKYRTEPIIGVVAREMAIAIVDSKEKVHLVRGIKRDKGLDVLTPGYQLAVRRDNGFNSDIDVVVPADGRVLAVKYPVMNDRNRFGAFVPVIQAIYTPYTDEIATPEIIKEGIEVQDDLIDKAYRKLKERQVYSMAFPGRKVTDMISKRMLTILLMNEHIDPGAFSSAAAAPYLVQKVLTTIGANREKAYAYTISPAGAFGLVQMIPSTYRVLTNKYPSAGLNPSFASGMTDAVNAIMAQVLLCDADWQTIREVQEVSQDRIGPYLAAAYNGGVGRVLSILRHDKNDWMDAPVAGVRPTITVTQRVPVRTRVKRGRYRTVYVAKTYTRTLFKAETSKYVMQYHWIEDYFEAQRSHPQVFREEPTVAQNSSAPTQRASAPSTQSSASSPQVAASARSLSFRQTIPSAIKVLDVRNHLAIDWYDKIEFEIQNVSDKPIYYMLIWLNSPDLKRDGVQVAFSLDYGDPRMVSLRESPVVTDQPIQPGEKVVLRLAPAQRSRGHWLKESGVSMDVKALEVNINTINFGDGTGFIGGREARR